MADLSLSKRTFIWAPKALAVISCALALLAAQPAVGGATTMRKGAVVVREGGMAAVEQTGRAGEMRERGRAGVPVWTSASLAGRLEVSLLSRAQHWRILATMEILHRLLAGELRGAERQVLPVVWFDEICLGAAGEPAGLAGRVEAAGEHGPVVERVFAIRHCLLAPPIC
jgi:hypothetical protein